MHFEIAAAAAISIIIISLSAKTGSAGTAASAVKEKQSNDYKPYNLIAEKIAKAVHILLSAVRSESEPFPFIIIYQGINRRLRLHGAYSQRRYGPHGFAPHFRAFPSL